MLLHSALTLVWDRAPAVCLARQQQLAVQRLVRQLARAQGLDRASRIWTLRADLSFLPLLACPFAEIANVFRKCIDSSCLSPVCLLVSCCEHARDVWLVHVLEQGLFSSTVPSQALHAHIPQRART